MRGYNILDPINGLKSIGDLNIGGSIQVVSNQPIGGEIREENAGNAKVEGTEGVQVEGVQAKGVEDAIFNPLSFGTEFDVNNPVDEENLINVPSDWGIIKSFLFIVFVYFYKYFFRVHFQQ